MLGVRWFYIIIIINVTCIPTILSLENPSRCQSSRLRFFPVTLNVSFNFVKNIKKNLCQVFNAFIIFLVDYTMYTVLNHMKETISRVMDHFYDVHNFINTKKKKS